MLSWRRVAVGALIAYDMAMVMCRGMGVSGGPSRQFLVLFGGVLLLGGCAASPRESEPAPVAVPVVAVDPPPFSPSGQALMEDRWWMAFGDAALDERIERAMSGNFSLAATWERIREARAVVRRESAAQRIHLDATAGAALREGDGVTERTQLNAGLEASYEVDLWGRIAASVEAEEIRARATEEDYRAAAISLAGELALAWYQLAEAHQQLELIASQLETNQKVLEVLERRFAVGQSGSADVLRQRQLVASTREQAVVAQSRVAVLEHQLAVLEGRAPQTEVSDGATRLPVIPAAPATGLSSALVQRRPDVRSAMHAIEASDRDVAVAVRDQYPQLNLSAALSSAAENPSGLFENWIVSLAGQLVAPLLDGGRRDAEVERVASVRRRLVSEYGQVVLESFREVEDALAQEAHQVRRIESIDQQLALAATTYRQLRTQYLNGAADFIDVLTALREQQQLARSRVSAELDRVSFRIALYRALAGGFETERESREGGASNNQGGSSVESSLPSESSEPNSQGEVVRDE